MYSGWNLLTLLHNNKYICMDLFLITITVETHIE